jgi:chromosome segregation ATPase
MINILANEKRHRQKMTQSLTEEKQKLKDISSKLLERDLKLKEIQTQLNNLKTQFKVETQKREQLEADLVKKLEDENQYKMEIAKLRMKGLKSA